MRRVALAIVGLLACTGCAAMSGAKDHYFVCSYDIVWDATLQSVKDRPIQVQSKEKGLIETNWVEMEGAERAYGMFQREGFGNRERARMTVAVKPMNDVVSVTVLETRQRWHLKGGITQEATKWWPIEPSEESEAMVMDRIKSSLNEKGCAST